MTRPVEPDLLVNAYQRLRDLLEKDSDGSVKLVREEQHGDGRQDAVWRIETSRLFTELVVQAYSRFTPRHVDQLVGGVSRLMRSMRDQPILVVAPWLSARSREQLTDLRINYLDLTGNVNIRVPQLPIIVHIDGATHDPFPANQPRRGLQGRSANALVRALVDFAPPYRMSELAKLTGLSPAYVSRTIDVLDEERLVDRNSKRIITDVDWPRLLHERARHYRLIKSNNGQGYIARTGLSAVFRALAVESGMTSTAGTADSFYEKLRVGGEDQALVTGSFAAQQYVKLAAPAQLVLYVPAPAVFAQRHGLMPADRGANVVLLRAAHRSQLERIQLVDGIFHAGLSQVALDCLGGNGRLPEEGEELIDWMRRNEEKWHERSLLGR